MAEVLTGKLEQLRLIDVLKMLNSSRRTGHLYLSQGGREGDIYLERGSLVHAATGRLMGERAVYTMMSWMQGDFSFRPDIQPPDESIELATEQILLESARKTEEWQDIKDMIPSNDIVFKLSPSGSPETVSLQPSEWQVLAQVNGQRSVGEITELLDRNEFEVAKILFSLTKAGLLEVGEAKEPMPEEIIPESFFKSLNAQYTEIMGPLGPVIIEDEIQTMGEVRDHFPRKRGPELVERLSAEIDDERKRTDFQEVMVGMLRNSH